MKKRLKNKLGLLGGLLFAGVMTLSSPAIASEEVKEHHVEQAEKEKSYTFDDVLTKGKLSMQIVSGVLIAPCGIGPDTPDFNYSQTNIRLGKVLNDPSKKLKIIPRGNLEAFLEISNSYVYDGFGDYVGGATILLRYNIIPEGSKWSPYVQVGCGIVYNDAYKDKTQKAIGQAIEFTPQGSVGCRYLINENWSIDGEIMLHHISNAGLAERNNGTNALGGFIGLTYYFD